MTKKPTTPIRKPTVTKAKAKQATSKPTIDTSKLSEQLKELRLPTFRENHHSTAEQAARDQWTHTQFLAHLVEQHRRHARVCQRLLHGLYQPDPDQPGIGDQQRSPHTQLATGADGLVDGLGPGPVARDALQAPTLGPATVPIHDDGHMPRDRSDVRMVSHQPRPGL